jgi:hypothetical protein
MRSSWPRDLLRAVVMEAHKVDGRNPDPLRQLVNDLRQKEKYALADDLCRLLNDRDQERARQQSSGARRIKELILPDKLPRKRI